MRKRPACIACDGVICTMSMSTMDSFAASVRRFSPRLLLSELLLKQWFEPVIPFTVMIGLWLYFALTIPDYATVQNSLSLLRLFAEFGFVALAMGFCLISGGIDLSRRRDLRAVQFLGAVSSCSCWNGRSALVIAATLARRRRCSAASTAS